MEGRRDQVADVAARAAALQGALESGEAWLDPAVIQRTRVSVAQAIQRLELGAGHTVVALVGATGSGKSSLFNALARMDIAEVGARRPLTTLPMACVWGEVGSGELLDWLDVPETRRVTRESVLDADHQAALHGLVLLDLPDHDSTEVIHRVEVDRLVGMVDLLVWVVDPQKYADDALHTGYLQRLGGHDAVMVVALNQIDRLGPEEAETCIRDLRRLLDGDGLESVRMLPISATRGDGIDDLRGLLASVVQNRSAIAERVDADLRAGAEDVARGLAPVEPGNGEPPGADRLVEELAAAAGVPAVLDALAAEYRRRGSIRTGWPVLKWLYRLKHRMKPDAMGRLGTVSDEDLRVIAMSLRPISAPSQRPSVQLAVDAAIDLTADAMPARWADALRASVSHSGDDLVNALDEAVATVDLELSPPPWWQFAALAQLLLSRAAVLGVLWLVVAGASRLVGHGPSHPVQILGIPLPLLLVILTLVGGAALAALSASALASGARRRRLVAHERLDIAVEGVAEERVIGPIRAVLARHRAIRLALAGGRGEIGQAMVGGVLAGQTVLRVRGGQTPADGIKRPSAVPPRTRRHAAGRGDDEDPGGGSGSGSRALMV
jgi:GTP-binding protein EngB required for normal cell division